LAGARGFQAGQDWVVPLASDADFTDIVVNSVKAPTYNRHYYATSSGAAIAAGVAMASGISTASDHYMKLEAIDFLRTVIDDSDLKLQPIKLADDPAAEDEPLYLLLMSARQWNSIFTNTSNTVWKTMLQNAWTRKSYGSKHPLFNGEPALWNGILMKKIDRAIRFNSGEAYRYVAAADRLTATETAGTIDTSVTAAPMPSIALLLWRGPPTSTARTSPRTTGGRRTCNFEENMEIAGMMMNGKAKVRFDVPDGAGNTEPTDHGVYVLDTTVLL
jgi:hypothetical protein